MTVKGILKWAVLLLGAGTVFGAMAVAILILRFDPPRVFFTVTNRTTEPITIVRLRYGNDTLAENLTLAPRDTTLRFCTWPKRRADIVLDARRAGEAEPLRAAFAVESALRGGGTYMIRVFPDQIALQTIGSEIYVSDNPCLFSR